MKSRRDRTEYLRERALMARRSVPELLELLASESLRTRFLAEVCLRDAAST